MEDLKKMSTSKYYKKKVSEAADERDAKNKARLKKKRRAAKKKWKDRGLTGYREREKADRKAVLDWSAKDTQILKDWKEDSDLVDEYGKDAPKARSFLTRSRKSHKGGGAVRKGRGMGAALRGGGAVTRS